MFVLGVASVAAILTACSSSGGPQSLGTSPSASPTAAPSPTVSPSPTVDPALLAKCQSDEDFMASEVDKYGSASQKLITSKQKTADFLALISTIGKIVNAVKKRSVDPAYQSDLSDLQKGLSDVRGGELKALYAGDNATYKAGVKREDSGHQLVLRAQGDLTADFIQCTGNG